MSDKLRTYYLESQINNASPGQLLIMLYDGLIEHAENADTEIAGSEIVPASRSITRCIDILTELNTCLRHNFEPKLCKSMGDLYLFFTRQFSEALEARAPEKIRAILPLIRDLRKTWSEADRRANQFHAEAVAVA